MQCPHPQLQTAEIFWTFIQFAAMHKSDKRSEQLQPPLGQKILTENPVQSLKFRCTTLDLVTWAVRYWGTWWGGVCLRNKAEKENQTSIHAVLWSSSVT